MDEVSIYNRALTAAEIAASAAAGSAGKCQEPDGTPYAYFNDLNRGTDAVALPDGPPVSTALLSTFLGGNIRYTLDGSPPTNGTPYTNPFPVTQSGSLRAIAYSTNGTVSKELSTQVYVLPAGSVLLNHVRIASVLEEMLTGGVVAARQRAGVCGGKLCSDDLDHGVGEAQGEHEPEDRAARSGLASHPKRQASR